MGTTLCDVLIMTRYPVDPCYKLAFMPNDPFYSGRKWRKTRREHLDENPWCAVCAAIYISTPATEVDHVSAKEKMFDPYDHKGLRSLCKQHHSQKTIATEGAHRGKKVFRVTGVDGWPINYGDEDGNK